MTLKDCIETGQTTALFRPKPKRPEYDVYERIAIDEYFASKSARDTKCPWCDDKYTCPANLNPADSECVKYEEWGDIMEVKKNARELWRMDVDSAINREKTYW